MHGTKASKRPHDRHARRSAENASATAGDVALRYISREVDTLVTRDPLVRQGDARAIHRTRVAARRIRSALSTFKPLFDTAEIARLREELQWLGGVLAPARESGVLEDRLLARVGDLPPELVIGPVVARIRSESAQRAADAVREAEAGLRDDRHARLVLTLQAFVAAPTLTAAARRSAVRLCRARVRAASRRVDRLARVVEAHEDGSGRAEALHDVRKAAKRARYAAEATTTVLGENARVLADRMAALQEVLGDHLDSDPAQRELRALGVRAHLAGENAFTYGLLLGVERADAAATWTRYPCHLSQAQRAARALTR